VNAGNVPDGGRTRLSHGVFPGQEITRQPSSNGVFHLGRLEPSLSHYFTDLNMHAQFDRTSISIWAEWASSTGLGQTNEISRGHSNERWLVSLVHHVIRIPKALLDLFV